MSDFIFEIRGSEVIPRVAGAPGVVLDGVTFLTDKQCAERFGQPAAIYREQWAAFYGVESNVDSPEVSKADDVAPMPASSIGLASTVRTKARLEIVRQVKFPHLNDQHWAYFIAECQRLNVDPTYFWVKLDLNEETGELEPQMITTLNVYRGLANRMKTKRSETLPQYAGPDGVWKEIWPGDEPPVAAKAGVVMTDGSVKEAIVTYKRCAQYVQDADGTRRLNKYWAPDPASQLGKCAIVAAHRQAFEHLGNVTTFDENDPDAAPPVSVPEKKRRPKLEDSQVEWGRQIEMPTSSVGPMNLPDDPKYAWRLVDDTTPDSTRGLKLKLMDLGIAPLAKAEEFIDKMTEKFPRVRKESLTAFCAMVLKAAG